MTDPHQHPTLKAVRLVLHQGRGNLTWSVTYRTSQGRDVFDRRVSAGQIAQSRPIASPPAVIEALEQVLRDLRERYGLPPAAGGPGAPGGGGGRPDQSHTEPLPTVPLSIVRDDP